MSAPRVASPSPSRRRGFTLMEVLIVIVILGILVVVAIPSYRKSIDRGHWREAQDLLMTIYYGERSYFAAENAYLFPLDENSPQTQWRRIFVDNPNLQSIPVTFRVSGAGAGPAATFTATATRNGTSRVMSINQLREWCGVANNNDPGNCPTWPLP